MRSEKRMRWKKHRLFVKEVFIFVKKLLIVLNIIDLILIIEWLRLKRMVNLILKKMETNIVQIK